MDQQGPYNRYSNFDAAELEALVADMRDIVVKYPRVLRYWESQALLTNSMMMTHRSGAKSVAQLRSIEMVWNSLGQASVYRHHLLLAGVIQSEQEEAGPDDRTNDPTYNAASNAASR